MSNISEKLINSPDGLNNNTNQFNNDITNIPNNKWGDVSNLLDYSPINLIKVPNKMNIQSVTDISGVDNNVAAMNQYYNTLYNGKNTASTITNNNEPLGERKFLPTGTKCNFNNSQVDKTYILDSMNYYKNADGSFDTTNTGLLHSAFGALQNINTDTNVTIPGPQYDNCVEVTIQKDGNTGNTIKNYISKAEYDNLSCTVFPKDISGNFCKTFTGNPNKCSPCKQTVNTNPLIDSSVESFHGGGGHHMHNNYYNNSGYGFGNYNGYNELQYMYNRGLYNGVVYEVIDDDTIRKRKEMVINNDFITQFYLGSITVLGLFILYKLMQKKD
jgi:hypothetical protein